MTSKAASFSDLIEVEAAAAAEDETDDAETELIPPDASLAAAVKGRRKSCLDTILCRQGCQTC